MSYVEVLNRGTRKARKEHQCFHCYRPIVKGEVYEFSTNKYDYVYTLCAHKDCNEAALFYMDKIGTPSWDWEDGYPPLADQISDNGEWDIDLNHIRGHFPHVTCRLEFHGQVRELRKVRAAKAEGQQ